MASRDFGRILLGLLIFLALVTFPLWYGAARDTSAAAPELVYPADETRCVESAAYMKAWHMDLLNEWRDTVVRRGECTYVSSADHREFTMSLQGTCMGCHTDKAAFCDRCHDYAGVCPKCWDCHVAPRGE